MKRLFFTFAILATCAAFVGCQKDDTSPRKILLHKVTTTSYEGVWDDFQGQCSADLFITISGSDGQSYRSPGYKQNACPTGRYSFSPPGFFLKSQGVYTLELWDHDDFDDHDKMAWARLYASQLAPDYPDMYVVGFAEFHVRYEW